NRSTNNFDNPISRLHGLLKCVKSFVAYSGPDDAYLPNLTKNPGPKARTIRDLSPRLLLSVASTPPAQGCWETSVIFGTQYFCLEYANEALACAPDTSRVGRSA